MSADPQDVATRAISEVATTLGLKVDPGQIALLAGFVLGALAGKSWAVAERAGLEAAAKVVDLTSADELGRAR